MAFEQFTRIAPHYDNLMSGIPYSLWVDYLEKLLERVGHRAHKVLDVACGTGTVASILRKRGYEVVGVDAAPAMIEIARWKVPGTSFLVQDISQIDVPDRFDVAISLFDSLNYVVDVDRLQKGLESIRDHLVDDGVFVFDINTEYALSHGFFNQSNIGSREYPRYVWSAEYDSEQRLCRVTMVFEVMEGGKPVQFTEVHYQRGYRVEELREMLSTAGFETLEVLHAYKFKQPTRRSDRVFFVAKKL
jgi:SAM-dependent methyltransferase